ncbi:DNA repair and recombination protein RadB, partial [mine drainage metagenome]
MDRLRGVAGATLETILKKLLLSTPKSLEEQSAAVRTACALARDPRRTVGLIVVDSATLYYRLSLSGDDEDDARRALSLEIAELVRTALEAHVPIVLTNQVWRNTRDGRLEPLGGSFLQHAAKTVLSFERLPGAERRAVLVKHRAVPEGSARFRITSTDL